MKRVNIKAAVLFGLILAVVYWVTRYCLPQFYTPEWGARRIYWFVCAVIFVPALLGKIRFSSISLMGYLLGLVLGELLGGGRAQIPPQYKHYGWLILIFVFAISCGIGAVRELRAEEKE